MTNHPEISDNTPSRRPEVLNDATELNGDEGGLWGVTTASSTYQFDLEKMTVTRIRGQYAPSTVNDTTRPIVTINHCRVGSGGYWTMGAEGDLAHLIEFFWQACTTIVSIQRVSAFDATP